MWETFAIITLWVFNVFLIWALTVHYIENKRDKQMREDMEWSDWHEFNSPQEAIDFITSLDHDWNKAEFYTTYKEEESAD